MSTLKDVAKRAGVSQATVSHVVNHTRYVSEELRCRVEEAMRELDYKANEKHKIVVGFLLRNFRCSLAEDMLDAMNYFYRDQGIEVISVLVPPRLALQELKTYMKRYRLDYAVLDYTVQLDRVRHHKKVELPVIFMNHDPEVYPLCFHINFDYRAAMEQALRHLLSLGHKKILVMTPQENPYTNSVVLEACRRVYRQNNMTFPQENLVELDTYRYRTEALPMVEAELSRRQDATAIITTEMMATMHVVEYLRMNEIRMPQDISLLAIGDIFLTKYLFFNRTRIDMRIRVLAATLRDIVLQQTENRLFTISPEFITGDTTKALLFDPFDRPAASAYSMELSEEDIARVRAGDYRISVSTFMETMPSTRSQLEGLRSGLNTLGIHLIQQVDAMGNYEVQNLQLRSLAADKPDAVICIPNLDENEVEPFRRFFPRSTRCILSSCIPQDFTANQYDTCITSNYTESGKQASKLLGKYMAEHGLIHAAFLCAGTGSTPARHRDQSAISTIREEFPMVKLDRVLYYNNSAQLPALVQTLLEEEPQIQTMYISQSRAAETVLGTLDVLGREDIRVVTNGISRTMVSRMTAHSNAIGIVSPNSYELGRLLALACARYFLGLEQPAFAAVDPVTFTPQNLSGAWLSVMKNKL